MERYFLKGAKKLFGLARTKIRLAEEAGTKKTRPDPLPLVERFSGQKLGGVEQAKDYVEESRQAIDFSDEKEVAEAVFQLLDIIEGVKYEFEPPEYMPMMDEKELADIEEKAKKENKKINLLLLSSEKPEGINLFVGENPPQEAYFLGRVPSTVAAFITYAFRSQHLCENGKLKNIRVFLGKETLIVDAIYNSLVFFGAEKR